MSKEREIEVQEGFKVRLKKKEAEYEQIIQGLQKEKDLMILEEQMAKVN